jgi:spermidine/putrescine transport system substrate-binding protein
MTHKLLSAAVLTLVAAVLLAAGALAACDSTSQLPTPTASAPARELVLYNWADYLPQSTLDAFTAEYGVKVIYETYDSMEEAVEEIKAGLAFDVAVVDNDVIPGLVADGLLAEIDSHQVPNFKNISANFRDLAFDRDNKYSVPNAWGTTGLLVRTDLVAAPVTRWADLWDKRYAGKIAWRTQPTELVTVALKALGYQVNSENPAELEAALQRLLELKPSTLIAEIEHDKAIASLVSGKAVIMIGWPGDAQNAQSKNDAIHYILPDEGAMLWGDSYVISSRSQNKQTAELFLDFLLRPEIAAEFVNTYGYATANEAARPFINQEILDNPALFPTKDDVANATWYMPLSPAGEKLYADIWERFMNAGDQ